MSHLSSRLLFSIPVHEEQDIINNQIENILNNNPGATIILHINKSFHKFNPYLTIYKNVYINNNRHSYIIGKGLLFIHISNFLFCINNNIDFEYFIILSSNEMFIKKGLIHYIEKYKNGVQLVKFDINNSWHNFHKNIENDPNIIQLLNELQLDTFYGGQTEGQFYQKYVFQYISDIYLKIFGKNELHSFETEEIVCQTIFKSMNLEYGLPFTLQNYCNKIDFNEKFIIDIIQNNMIIPNHSVYTTLTSPHIGFDCSSIFSIKRVNRIFYPIRDFLSNKGFNISNDHYEIGINYYSNNSILKFIDHHHISFIKYKFDHPKYFNWFGYNIDIGNYELSFKIKLNKYISINEHIGLKINYPYNIIYNFFLKDIVLDTWIDVSFPITIYQKDIILFIFDHCLDEVDIEIKDFTINEPSSKDNILIFLYDNFIKKNYMDYLNVYNNIYNKIIKKLKLNYHIYIFIFTEKENLYPVLNIFKPNCYHIYNRFSENINHTFITNFDTIFYFSNKYNINFKFIMMFGLYSIFDKNIEDLNIYIHKFNLYSFQFPYIDGYISNSIDYLLIPNKYYDKFYNLLVSHRNNPNICNLLYYYLKDDIEFNFITQDNKLTQISDLNTFHDGFLLHNDYYLNIIYYNKYSKFYKIKEYEFYYYKNITLQTEYFQWFGYYIHLNQMDIKNNICNISFDIKLLKNIDTSNQNFGIKIHEPLTFYNSFFNQCIINEYVHFDFDIQMNLINQYILFHFDNYLKEIEFCIKNFKILFNY